MFLVKTCDKWCSDENRIGSNRKWCTMDREKQEESTTALKVDAQNVIFNGARIRVGVKRGYFRLRMETLIFLQESCTSENTSLNWMASHRWRESAGLRLNDSLRLGTPAMEIWGCSSLGCSLGEFQMWGQLKREVIWSRGIYNLMGGCWGKTSRESKSSNLSTHLLLVSAWVACPAGAWVPPYPQSPNSLMAEGGWGIPKLAPQISFSHLWHREWPNSDPERHGRRAWNWPEVGLTPKSMFSS